MTRISNVDKQSPLQISTMIIGSINGLIAGLLLRRGIFSRPQTARMPAEEVADGVQNVEYALNY